jgi:hypothetical protein
MGEDFLSCGVAPDALAPNRTRSRLDQILGRSHVTAINKLKPSGI